MIDNFLLLFAYDSRQSCYTQVRYLHFSQKVVRHRFTVDLRHSLNDHLRLVYPVFAEQPSWRLGNDPVVTEEKNERNRGSQRQGEPMPKQVTLRKRGGTLTYVTAISLRLEKNRKMER